jgi:hypothetical protein
MTQNTMKTQLIPFAHVADSNENFNLTKFLSQYGYYFRAFDMKLTTIYGEPLFDFRIAFTFNVEILDEELIPGFEYNVLTNLRVDNGFREIRFCANTLLGEDFLHEMYHLMENFVRLSGEDTDVGRIQFIANWSYAERAGYTADEADTFTAEDRAEIQKSIEAGQFNATKALRG